MNPYGRRASYEDEEENEDLYSFGMSVDDEAMPDMFSSGDTFLRGGVSGPQGRIGFGNPPPTSNVFGNYSQDLYNSNSNPWLNAQNSNDAFVPIGDEMQRPMTSVNAVGFTSKARDLLSENFGEFGRGRAPPLEKRSDNSPEDMAREKEKRVNLLLEESAKATAERDHQLALEKAKEAVKKEKALCRFREEKNSQEQNLDLTFAVQFNLARVYQANSMYTEALDTYLSLVKNKNFPNAGRLRVNMGNIYFEQKKYSLAKQMYIMALDQIMATNNNNMRNKIMKNIAITHLKTGKYDEAAEKFLEIVEGSNNDVDIAFNLLLCHYARGKKDDMKEAFRTLLDVKIQGLKQDEDLDDEQNSILNDDLRNHLKNTQRKHYELILTGAKLIAEVIEDDWEKGYDYVIEQCKRFEHTRERCNIVSELDMTKALNYMKHKKFAKAIEALKLFEKKDRKHQAISATNLCYLYLLEEDLENAVKYANIAVQTDKYNANALVNKGICYYLGGKFEEAKNMFIDALNNEADCVQAMYNLGLTTKAMGQFPEALSSFQKLYSIIPDSIEVLYEIGSLYYRMNDNENAIKWFNMLSSRVPTDPGILYDLGSLYAKENDESQAYNSYLESYRLYPINVDVTSWLGLYFVKHEIYEKALLYFERATQIHPNHVEWQLMAASCHRRIGAYQQAKKWYESIHQRYPENRECLRYLVILCDELGLKKEKKQYTKKLMELEERQKQKNEGTMDEEEDSRPRIDDDDAVRNAIEQKAREEALALEQKKEQEQREKDLELERLRALEAEYLILQQGNMKPVKKGVKFVDSDDMMDKKLVNDKRVENNDDEFLGIDDGIDDLYS